MPGKQQLTGMWDHRENGTGFVSSARGVLAAAWQGTISVYPKALVTSPFEARQIQSPRRASFQRKDVFKRKKKYRRYRYMIS